MALPRQIGLTALWDRVAAPDGFVAARHPEEEVNEDSLRRQRDQTDLLFRRQNHEAIQEATGRDGRQEDNDFSVYALRYVHQIELEQQFDEAYQEYQAVSRAARNATEAAFLDLERRKRALDQEYERFRQNAIRLADGRYVFVGKNDDFYDENGNRLTGEDDRQARAIRDANPDKNFSSEEHRQALRNKYKVLSEERQRLEAYKEVLDDIDEEAKELESRRRNGELTDKELEDATEALRRRQQEIIDSMPPEVRARYDNSKDPTVTAQADTDIRASSNNDIGKTTEVAVGMDTGDMGFFNPEFSLGQDETISETETAHSASRLSAADRVNQGIITDVDPKAVFAMAASGVQNISEPAEIRQESVAEIARPMTQRSIPGGQAV